MNSYRLLIGDYHLAPHGKDSKWLIVVVEQLCCAISDKTHQVGVTEKRKRFGAGHVCRKLDEKSKVFIEYAPLETAGVPVSGDNYIYICCLWVSGRFKGRSTAGILRG